MTPTNDDKSNELYAALPGMGVIGLILVLTIVTTLRLVDHLGPRIGDIITFNPARQISPDLQERITVRPGDDLTAVPCILDPRTMMASGGSLVIKAVQLKPDPKYRVDWAGMRTSDGLTDCGVEAEFLLSQPDLVALLLAAGK
jgi:hypothetical protein